MFSLYSCNFTVFYAVIARCNQTNILHMKQILFYLFLGSLSMNLFGQFPSPKNFSVLVEYVEMDGMGWTDCGDSVLHAPAYCTRMSWSVPDTNTTESSLVRYNVYQDGHLRFSVDKNKYSENLCIALTGNMYITATYSNPEGESAHSNSVFISSELPIGLNEIAKEIQPTVLFNESTQRIEIRNYEVDIESIALYNLYGKLMVISKGENCLSTNALSGGIYIVEITNRQKRIQHIKIKVN